MCDNPVVELCHLGPSRGHTESQCSPLECLDTVPPLVNRWHPCSELQEHLGSTRGFGEIGPSASQQEKRGKIQ